MSIPVVYGDSGRSKYFSTDDFTSLSDYHHSFRTMVQTSDLRMAIAPGTVKDFNKPFQNAPDVHSKQWEQTFAPTYTHVKDDSDYAKVFRKK